MRLEIRQLRWVGALFALFSAVSILAAEVNLSIQPQLISLMDRAVMKLEFVDTQGEAVDFPQIDGLDIQYQGPRSETRIVNFKTTSKVVHTYLVTPSKVGDYTIGPVIAKFRGGEKELSAQLRVIKPKDDPQASEISDMLFSRVSSERVAPHVHEPFDLTLKVHLRDGVQIDGNFSILGGMPETGMDGEAQWRVVNREREEINGSIYTVWTLNATVKTLTAGAFTFQPRVRMNIVVPRQRRRQYGFDDPFFGDLFGRQETRPFVLDCNALEVNVRPVPMEGRPDSFTGGVGIFDFDVEVGPSEVKAGEPITIRMRVAGDGNLSQITPPLLEGDHELKLYDARSVATDDPNEILFEQVVIPKSGSVSNIPAIAFSYFNTKTTDFRTIKQGPFSVNVEEAPQRAAQVISTAPSAVLRETKVLGRDIVYLKPAPSVWRTTADARWYASTLARVLLALPSVLLLLTAAFVARRARLANNQALARRQKAPGAARKHAQQAARALRANDPRAFHEHAWNALVDYFGHRLNLAPGEVTAPIVLKRIPREHKSVERLFETIERRRYGDLSGEGGSRAEMKALARELNATLKKCERMKL